MNRQRLGAGALVLAVLALGRVVTDRLPDPIDVLTATVERPATLREPLSLHSMDVTITELTGAKSMVNLGTYETTPGVWLVFTAQITPRDKDLVAPYAAIRAADGMTWAAVGRSQVYCDSAIPGLPTQCIGRIEVPPDRLTGASLLISANRNNQSYEDMAVLPLRVTENELQTWLARTDDRALALTPEGLEP